MDTEEKLFNQIKSAAQNSERQDFPSMDKVWNRVEEKLDHKVLAKQNTLWKKTAMAAFILLVISIGYQFFKEDPKIPAKITIVKADSLVKPETSVKGQQVVSETAQIVSPKIKKNTGNAIPIQAENSQAITAPPIAEEKQRIAALHDYMNAPREEKKSSGSWLVDTNFKSRGVTSRNDTIVFEANKLVTPNPKKEGQKDEPLIVLNGKTSSKNDAAQYRDGDIESIMVLPDPLYIINGVRYSEQELFGPNPTSPYAPLNKQKIETISILQDEKAISIYGENGKKGVVIITTKDGKPAAVKGK